MNGPIFNGQATGRLPAIVGGPPPPVFPASKGSTHAEPGPVIPDLIGVDQAHPGTPRPPAGSITRGSSPPDSMGRSRSILGAGFMRYGLTPSDRRRPFVRFLSKGTSLPEPRSCPASQGRPAQGLLRISLERAGPVPVLGGRCFRRVFVLFDCLTFVVLRQLL